MLEIDLDTSDGKRILVVDASISDITNWAWSLNLGPSAVTVRFVRGKKMKTFQDLFDEFSAALQFPYYFGENWNAFAECITDLEWLPGSEYIIVISDANKLLRDDSPEQMEAIVEYLAYAGEELANEDRNFIAIFQQAPNTHQIIERLRNADADFRVIKCL